jgi:hypothetical protein
VFPDARVARLLNEAFVPVQFHVKRNPDAFKRFKVQWTPTHLVIDPENWDEVYRVEGFSPVDDLLGKLKLGRGKWEFARERYEEADRWFQQVCEQHPDSAAAPEGCYWAGVSEYKATNRPERLRDTARVLDERFHDSEWARKASVWAA